MILSRKFLLPQRSLRDHSGEKILSAIDRVTNISERPLEWDKKKSAAQMILSAIDRVTENSEKESYDYISS